MATNQILVAVDDSDATARAVGYVGDLMRGTEATIRLVHVLPPPPPAIQEGDREPGGRGRQGAGVALAVEHHVEEGAKRAHPVLDRMRRRLVEDGVPEGRVALECYAPAHHESVPEALLELACERGCDTIVIGRHSHPWYRQLFKRHVGNQLVRHARGRTVWVVE